MIVKEIAGITFIDAIALENAITKDIPVKHHLRQKMILAGVEFWNAEQTIVKKPVIGISAVGSFSVCLEGDLPPQMIKLRFGDIIEGPFHIHSLANGFRTTMGMQSSHTYMNPYSKPAKDLYEKTVEHNHFSMAHSTTLGITCLGLSKKAELEFDVQRDVVHLARETSARSSCQDDPTLVAMTAAGAQISLEVLKSTQTILDKFVKSENILDWREERNALFPLSACVSLGINGSLKDFLKLVSAMNDPGKELEFRNALALMNDSLNAFFPELFPASRTYGFAYPESFRASQTKATFFTAATSTFKNTILLLGAPGVGKSTQTELIMKQQPDVLCVSTGNLARKLQAKIAEGKQTLTPVEQWTARSFEEMNRGGLLDDEAIYALLFEYLSPGGEGHAAFSKAQTVVLDGVIKSERNLVPFENALQRFNENKSNVPIRLSKVINLAAPQAELIKRQQSRVSQAQALGQTQRSDDTVVFYQQRLEKYLASIENALTALEKRYPFVEIDTTNGLEETTLAIIKEMDGSAVSLGATNRIS